MMRDHSSYGVCDICKNKFVKKSLLQSTSNTYYCTNCFKSKFCSASNKSPRIRRYHDRKPKKLIPNPEMYTNKRSRSVKNLSVHTKSTNLSCLSLSKRPLQCPHADCNKCVSIYTLESHFKYEHKEVPIIITQFDARSALEFYPKDIRYGITQCIVLFNVINRNFSTLIPNKTTCTRETYWTKSQLDMIDSKPVMVLLATRIASCLLAEADYLHRPVMEDIPEYHHLLDDSVLKVNDKIIIWLASNVNTNFSYTVASSTLSNEIRVKYFGSLLPLGDAPTKLCMEGKCLILTHFHCDGMSENGTKPLALDIVIHNED